ncbi:Glycine cleavage system H protein [Maioricimonas rarisocia]|uniref:Glycine cleavage system H protein n=1 Tax=Maioricimonas rarisocia TaxID=2528026 RepID=A0A517Z858_9PLAN|nr:glycine cleavage system protein GcvH [Maioricimonas rarisocia]QDU38680.1 Glycine cleavage system H protein [Maioricimonas rarisocia]
MDPSQLKYARTHEWVHLEGDVATIGISKFAVEELTDLVYIDLPTPGDQLTKGATFGEVESVKAVSDLYSPVAGEVVEANNALPDDLAALSDDPYGKGWMVRVKVSNASDLDDLMDAIAYEEFCKSQG